ncbi:MAG: type II toxin-antitoxin system CcdA family antitoxin [Betaproteobacteria bacterium]|nr:type II toxin-antitoxin system CcdA family antitoxin [Betaproteobacteria bacterium]
MVTRTNTPRRRKKAANPSEAIRQRLREEWLRKNRAALDAYNEHIEEHGVFSDVLRSF